MKLVLLLCAGSLVLNAQVIEVSSTSASHGERAELAISIRLTKDTSIMGLQWETTFPTEQMSVEGGGPVASEAARGAGKSLTCAGKEVPKSGLYSYTCILIGGQKEITSGPLAVVKFRVSPNARPGETTVRVGNVEAVTKKLQNLHIPDAAGVIKVKR